VADRVSRRVWGILFVAALIAAGLAFAGYRWWTERYTVTVQEDGTAVTQIVVATLSGASALKVATVSGVVQSSAADTRLGGLLSSDQVMKAPFSVDYMLDLRGLRPSDLQWDAAARRLTIDAPDVTVSPPNIDEARRTLVRTRGLFVTRRAAEELQRRTALGAERAARVEANRPERIRQARDHARRALEQLLSAPLAAAGLRVASVEVRFPDERNRSREQWDMSRPPDEVVRGH
jgi:hypothetical protein